MSRTVKVVSAPARQTVASYTTYAEAQRAVDHLSDNRFPVDRTAIVAEGLKFVEQVTGRLNWWRALLNGAVAGGLTGFFVGLFFSLLTLLPVLALVLYGLLVGLVTGAIFGLVGYAISGGQRDFTSVSGMQAERYNVLVDSDLADEARGLLEGLG